MLAPMRGGYPAFSQFARLILLGCTRGGSPGILGEPYPERLATEGDSQDKRPSQPGEDGKVIGRVPADVEGPASDVDGPTIRIGCPRGGRRPAPHGWIENVCQVVLGFALLYLLLLR